MAATLYGSNLLPGGTTAWLDRLVHMPALSAGKFGGLLMWSQVYDPFGSAVLSTIVAALPIFCLLGLIAFARMQAHLAALIALALSLAIAIVAFGMPTSMALKAAGLGALTGLFPIGWIILNVIFLYRLTVANGSFKVLQDSIAGITSDRRLQLLLVAFAFGAFFEGAGGFGTPVAVT